MWPAAVAPVDQLHLDTRTEARDNDVRWLEIAVGVLALHVQTSQSLHVHGHSRHTSDKAFQTRICRALCCGLEHKQQTAVCQVACSLLQFEQLSATQRPPQQDLQSSGQLWLS